MKKIISAIVYMVSMLCFLLLIVSGLFFILHFLFRVEAHFLSGTVFLVSSLAFWISGMLLNILSNQHLRLSSNRMEQDFGERLPGGNKSR